MAVIQISRIQQRRGQKLATGIPQLSSAELAWAVDTQELFIGNGSVAEGAPYVGNTRILTEHSNIFEDAVYQFMPTVMGNSVPRKAQDKLDEYVSVLDFIEKDQNGVILWADTFEAAIHDLFVSTNHNYRKVLTIPNGTYTFARHWSLQTGVILRGESQDNVILNMGGYTINSGSVSDVKLQNFTIQGTGPVLNLTGLTNSSIENVTVNGTYSVNVSANWYTPSIVWSNLVNTNKTDYVDFINCKFDTVNTAVLVTQTDVFETNVKFDNCSFTNSFRGIAIDGIIGQSNRWIINDCLFSDIYNSAFVASHGKNTLIRNSAFYRCGNGTGTAENPLSIIILFGDVANNLVVDCSCDRRSAVSRSVSVNTEAIPDAENTSSSTFVDYTNIDLVLGNKNTTAFSTFSSTTDYIIVDYGVAIGDYTRTGKLHITVGDLVANVQAINVIDNYSHSSAVYDPNGNDLTQQFEFGVSPTSTRNSVVLTYTNGSGSIGEFVYKVSFGSVQSVVVPTQFQAIPGNHTIYVSWDPNSSPNGSPVAGYSLIIT